MIGWEYPPFLSGGLGVHCYELSRRLAELGIEVDFYMPATRQTIAGAPGVNVIQVGPANREEAELAAGTGAYGGESTRTRGWWEKIQPIDLQFFDAVAFFNELCWRRLAANHQRRRDDVIHCHDWVSIVAGARAKEKTGLPLVFTVHSTEYDRSANLWPMQWIVNLEKLGVERADRIITVSEMTKRELVDRFGADEAKIRVVYNAVDYSFFANHSKKRLADDGRKLVLFHGRLSVQKGAEYFLRAAKRVLEKERDVRFVVSGKGEQLPYLVKLAVELGIADKVTFTGYSPEEELPSLYASADVYVLPSVSEPFGITVLEAMASGTPVILSKNAGVAEVAKNCLRVDFWDVDEMAAKIVALLRYPSLGREMRKMERREASRFSWADTAAKTLQVYCEAIASGVALPVMS